ncbi:ricin-type beta-trefoil lectin domain protein [Streptomyces sp. NBC_00453]|uniref:ricin-type beta-trefoil lectin domain protein n=1 Tax=Streptomyces sp. NBC_00453 TaxID=2903653 RepID=UPI002E23BD04
MLHLRPARTTTRSARSGRSPARRRLLGRVLAAALTTLVAVPVSLLTGASPAAAAVDPTQFRGVNWARIGDNFGDDPLVLEGMSATDTYATVKAKADAVYSGFQSTVGANTIRLPINRNSVPGTAWGDAYAGAVDAATAKGFNVVLSYWEDAASSAGKVVDTATFNAMWDAVIAKYGSNSRVYFEPMNEPHGYSDTDWRNFAATWIARYPTLPKERIFVSGTGYNGDVTSVCSDSRLAGTYLSLHLYAFQFSARSYADWVSLFNDRIGTCGARTVLEEFGAPMDDGRNYNDAGSTDNYVRYLRAATDTVRAKGMGAIYWPALGGKRTVRPDYDWYSLYALQGTGTNLSLSVRNTTMVDRLEYAWNTGDGSPTTTLRNVGVPGCLDVPGASQLNGTQTMIYTCNGGTNQKWTRTAGGQITVYGGTKCLEATAAGTVNGTAVGINDCNGAANQKWTFYSDGTIHGAQSGRCLDVKQTTSRTQLWDCWGGTNQKWQIV